MAGEAGGLLVLQILGTAIAHPASPSFYLATYLSAIIIRVAIRFLRFQL
jgi:hypothetical protein